MIPKYCQQNMQSMFMHLRRQLRHAAVEASIGLPAEKRPELRESSEVSDETAFLDLMSSSLSSNPGALASEAESMCEVPVTPTAADQVCQLQPESHAMKAPHEKTLSGNSRQDLAQNRPCPSDGLPCACSTAVACTHHQI